MAVQPYRGTHLLPRFDQVKVDDVMRAGVIACPPETSLRTLAQMMAGYHVHCVVVTGIAADESHGERLVWGIVSDMDLVDAARRDGGQLTAGDLARTDIVTVGPGERLTRAAELMSEHDNAHLVVVDEPSGRPIGVVSSLDIAGALAWGAA